MACLDSRMTLFSRPVAVQILVQSINLKAHSLKLMNKSEADFLPMWHQLPREIGYFGVVQYVAYIFLG